MKQIIAVSLVSPVLKNGVGQVPPSAFSSSHRPSSELSGLCGPSTYLPWVFAPRASYMSGSLAPASRHIFATQPKRYNDSGDLGEISSSLEHSAKLSGEDVPEKGRISSLLSCRHCLPCVVVNPAQEKQIQPCEVNTPKTRILKPTILLEAQAVLLPGNAPSPAQVGQVDVHSTAPTRECLSLYLHPSRPEPNNQAPTYHLHALHLPKSGQRRRQSPHQPMPRNLDSVEETACSTNHWQIRNRLTSTRISAPPAQKDNK